MYCKELLNSNMLLWIFSDTGFWYYAMWTFLNSKDYKYGVPENFYQRIRPCLSCDHLVVIRMLGLFNWRTEGFRTADTDVRYDGKKRIRVINYCSRSWTFINISDDRSNRWAKCSFIYGINNCIQCPNCKIYYHC